MGVLQAQTTFTYDGRGNRTRQQEEMIRNGVSIGRYVIDTAYDGMGQKSAETEQGCKTTTFTYECGRLQSIQKADGVILTHHYDSLGRLQYFVSSDGTIEYFYIYDLNDNLLNAKDCKNGTATSRAYDYLNRMIAETLSNGLSTAYSYDEQSRLKEFIFLNHKIVYDYSPTQLIRATRYQDNQPIYAYTQAHNLRGKPIQATLPNQSTLFYQWDKMGRCAHISSETYNQSLFYDALGNLSRTSVQDAVGAYDAIFQYDDLNQLTQESGHCTNYYNYDSIHNLHVKNQTSRATDALNQLTHDGIYSYTYDHCGRRITKGNESYRYDALGRLLSYTRGDVSVVYQYDPLGRRVNCSTPSSSTCYFYQFDTEIGSYDGALKEFRMIQGKHAPVSIELNGAIYSLEESYRI